MSFSLFYCRQNFSFFQKISKWLNLNWFDEYTFQPIKFVVAESKFMYADCIVPLTYTYLDCLLGVKMRGHKMAKI